VTRPRPLPDPSHYATRALSGAVLLGTCLIAVATLLVRAEQRRGAAPALLGSAGTTRATADSLVAQAAGTLPAGILVTGTFLGLMVAALTAWTALAPIENIYRRLGLAIVAGFGALVLGMFTTMPLDASFGTPGLVLLVVLTALFGAVQLVRLRALR